MKKSIHFGLNYVDPAHYEGWDGRLVACEADATDMQYLASEHGFSTQVIATNEATAERVSDVLREAAREAVSGDTLFITYSGHGGQVPDINGDERYDKSPGGTSKQDETWVLWNRQFIDDELHAILGEFRRGVRILMLSDSCHSGSVVRVTPGQDDLVMLAVARQNMRPRMMTTRRSQEVYRAHKEMYDSIQMATKPRSKVRINASVVLISGCQDNQYSMDGDYNGLFTGTLKKVLQAGFVGSLRDLRNKIASLMPAYQTPNYFRMGRTNYPFESMHPFIK